MNASLTDFLNNFLEDGRHQPLFGNEITKSLRTIHIFLVAKLLTRTVYCTVKAMIAHEAVDDVQFLCIYSTT